MTTLLPHPPRAPLFPYTTLFRSSSSPTGTQFLQGVGSAEASMRAKLLQISEGFENDEVTYISTGDGTTSEGEFWERSEEHTSELQSQSNLVCRLLLEKKNNTTST